MSFPSLTGSPSDHVSLGQSLKELLHKHGEEMTSELNVEDLLLLCTFFIPFFWPTETRMHKFLYSLACNLSCKQCQRHQLFTGEPIFDCARSFLTILFFRCPRL